MAVHQVPQDGTKHLHVRECPCNPRAGKKRVEGILRTVYAHQEQPPPATADVADLPDVADMPEAPCGHLVVDGEHHQIPDDGAPHAPTSECGCAPQRDTSGPHAVYVHPDQGADDDTEQLYREVFSG